MVNFKIKSAINKIQTQVRNTRINAKEKEIRRLVDLREVIQPDAYKHLYEAREVLANYAKANNVRYTFITATKNVKPNEKKIFIYAINDKHLTFKRIDSDTKKVEIAYKNNVNFLQDKEVIDHKHSYEDNFLRRVYRTVQKMTTSLNNVEYTNGTSI